VASPKWMAVSLEGVRTKRGWWTWANDQQLGYSFAPYLLYAYIFDSPRGSVPPLGQTGARYRASSCPCTPTHLHLRLRC
jgi:hypothetical protein